MPLIHIDTNPTRDSIGECWERIAHDPERASYLADVHPQQVSEFLALCGDTILPCVISMQDDPAALVWLSNVTLALPQMTPLSADMQLYLLPRWRDKPISPECAQVILYGLAGYGFEHLCTAVRLTHYATRNALDACHFTQQAILHRWQRYGGIWCDVAMYDSHFERA